MNEINNNGMHWFQTELGALISKSAVLVGDVEIGSKSVIEDFTIIGKVPWKVLRHEMYPDEQGALISSPKVKSYKTRIGECCHIQSHTIIYVGAKLEDNVLCADFTQVGTSSVIGSHTKLQYRAQVHKRVRIGERCRIGGFCCNDSVISDDCSMYGVLVHHYEKHGSNTILGSPFLESGVVVGFNSVIVGGIVIERNSYIAAGSVVSRNVPADSIVTGVNKIIPRKDWKGRIVRMDEA